MKHIRLLILAAFTFAVISPSTTFAETVRETANKQVVIDYFAALDRLETLRPEQAAKELPAILARYCRTDYIQHNDAMAAFGQGTAGLLRMFESRAKDPAARPGLGASHLITVMAQGDLVVRINTREPPDGGPPLMIFNLFRIKDGLIAEHWDGYSGALPK